MAPHSNTLAWKIPWIWDFPYPWDIPKTQQEGAAVPAPGTLSDPSPGAADNIKHSSDHLASGLSPGA